MLVLKCLWGICLGLCSYVSAHDKSRYNEGNQRQAESRLKHRLLKDYDPEVRPLVNISDTIDVYVTFNPIRIDDLDLRSEVFKITGWSSLTWRDQFLQWDPEKESNITCLLLHREDIWIPPLSIFNSMRSMLMSHDTTHYSQAQVCWDGLVHYVTMEHFVLSCDVDINFFPFDRQKCDIKVMSWYHHSGELRLLLVVKDQAINCSLYEEDGEWVLLHTAIHADTVPSIAGHSRGRGQAFPMLVFSLTMLRRPTYYVVNVLLPCLMLCVLVLINFFLPPDSGEKVSLGITVLLAFTVFQLLIADIVPTSAVRTPKLAIFLLCIMATSTSSIIISVLVLDLHHRAICTQPPVWLRRLVLDLLARLVCMHDSHMMRHVVQPFIPESRECHTPSADMPCEAAAKQSASMMDTKFRLTVEEAAVGEGGLGNQCNNPLKMTASDFTLQQRKRMDMDPCPLSVHRPHELGGSEHRLTGVAGLTTARNVRRMGSSERELTCQSLILNPDSAHTIFPLQTKFPSLTPSSRVTQNMHPPTWESP